MSERGAAGTVARMTLAAEEFVEAMDAPRRAKASFAFDEAVQRTDWAYFPRNHAGLPLHEMDLRQQKLAHVLISSALSLHAYAQVNAIMALEHVLNLIEDRRADGVRDPGRYFVSVFGVPGDDRWGWRLEGHHVALNFTIVGDSLISPTPIFLGANPAEVRHGAHAVTRPCGEEEDAARALLASLDADRRRIAVIADVAPPDFVLANLPAVPLAAGGGEAVPPVMRMVRAIQDRWEALPETAKVALAFDRAAPRGLAAGAMDAAQRHALESLIAVYVSRLPDDLASLERAKIERAGIDAIHFAWAGSEARGEGHYYRLQGPSFLVEYDNTQDDANHVHAVWRDPQGDFGADLLREHLLEHH
jgi:hypothetical protein